MSVDERTVTNFAALFQGFPTAYGTGSGGWVHSNPSAETFRAHLEGDGVGIGIGPLLPDDTCHFAAIDLDRPDFELAKEMMKLLPGVSWLERSRSGNAHVLVFFSDAIEAWVPRGIMRMACASLGEKTVEVFPKTDHLLPGMVGNYLNLPYFGDTRPVIARCQDRHIDPWGMVDDTRSAPLQQFVDAALRDRNDPADWRKRARWLDVPSPKERAEAKRDFGTSPYLHKCAEYVIEHRESNPVVAGHRAVVYFSLSKMLANWSAIDRDEALGILASVNDASPDPISMEEMERIYKNAERGQFTSTGCDDPLFAPYKHPECRIGE